MSEFKVRCLVKKYSGDFLRASSLGYGINNHCAESYMWLSLPSLPGQSADSLVKDMNWKLEKDGFTKVSEVEFQ